jgi:Ca2+/Na+ antiporter
MSVLPTTQNQRRALYRNLMTAAMGLLVLAVVAGRVFSVPTGAIASVILVGIGLLALLQFNSLDEVAKQAHYVAWYWGSLLAMSVIVAVNVLFALTKEAPELAEAAMIRWLGEADAATGFLTGLMVAPVLMVLGFSGWWAAYWLRRR